MKSLSLGSLSLHFLFLPLLGILWTPLTQSYHWDGNTMYDLEYQGSNFNTEAIEWNSSFTLVTTGVKTTQCGSNRLLGGYNIMSGISYPNPIGEWSRTYSDLPSHNTITFQGTFYMIDSWEIKDDHFHLHFDSFDTIMWWIYSDYATYASANLCGNSTYKDLDPMIINFTVPHTATNLTFKMSNHFQKTSNLQSVGFRDIKMTFSTEKAIPSLSCTGAYVSDANYQKVCTCAAGTYLTLVTSGLCAPCDSSCLTCSAAGSSRCSSCAAGKYLKSGSCYLCDSSCLTCNGAGSSMCTSCVAGEYLKNGSCYLCDSSCKTCSGPGPSMCTSCAAGEYLKNGSCYLCDSPCKTCNGAGTAACTSCEVGEFLSNNSCYASCEDPLVKSSNGGVDYCDSPCPRQYAERGGICSESCESPRIQTTLNGFAVCTSPCQEDSEYFYEVDKRCSTKCESPYKIEVVETVKICKAGATISVEEAEKIQETVASIKTQGKFTSGGMKAASAINSNSPSSALLAGLSSMMQYIRYMKINYPPKVQMLFNVSADAPISLGFDFDIPGDVKKHLMDKPLPDAFEKYDINSNFVSNLWDFMMSLGIILITILMLAIIKMMTSGFPRINTVVAKVLQALKWNFPLMMICGSSGDIFFFASLQLRSSPFESLSSTICCILSILMMIMVVLLLAIAFKIAHSIHRRPQNQWKGFEILYSEYEERSFFSLAYMLVFISRGIIFNLTLATLFDYPMVQCGIINSCNVAMICYIVYLRPLKDLFAQIQLWVNEGLVNILSISVMVLGILDQMGINQEATRVGVGNVILFAIKAFNAAALVFMAIGMLLFVISIWRKLKNLRAKNTLQMLKAMVFGVRKEERINLFNEKFSKNLTQIEKEKSNSIDIEGGNSITNSIVDTSSQQVFRTKILQTEIQGVLQANDLEMSQSFFDIQRRRSSNDSNEAQNMSFVRIKKVRVRRKNEILTSSKEEKGDFEKKNEEEDETKKWYSKLRKLKYRLNQNSTKKIDLTIETNNKSYE